jgi:hypothetical protein
MKIQNPTQSADISLVLNTFADLVKSNLTNIDIQLMTEPSTVKGEIIVEILIAVVTGLAANSIYDLLKLAISRHKGHISGEQTLSIDGKVYTVNEIADNKVDRLSDKQ